MPTTPSDRVQLIDRGSLMHPGCCALCGSGNCEDGYVDTGIYYDYEGQVYFCWTCAHQITEVIGGFSADETRLQKELLDSTVAELSSVKAELEAANVRLGHYDAVMERFALSPDPANTSDSSSDPVSEESEPVEPPTDEPTESANAGEPVTKKSVKSSGRRVAPRTERSDKRTADAGFTN